MPGPDGKFSLEAMQEMAEGVKQTRELVYSCIQRFIDVGYSSQNIFLLGFSQAQVLFLLFPLSLPL